MNDIYRSVNLRRGSIRSSGLNLGSFSVTVQADEGEGPYTEEEIKASEEKAGSQFPNIFHYTNLPALYSICQNKKLWATNTFYLNDTEETKYALGLYLDGVELLDTSPQDKKNIYDWLCAYLPHHAPANICACCFSRHLDSLNQWRAYAPKGGFCVGFDFSRLKLMTDDKTTFLGQVIYHQPTQLELVKREFNKLIGKLPEYSIELFGITINAIHNLLYTNLCHLSIFLKHPAFGEEYEVRLAVIADDHMVKYRTKNNDVIPYVEIDLVEYDDTKRKIFESIRFGPSKDDFFNRQFSIQAFLRSHNLACDQYIQSNIPYQDS